MTTYSVRCRNGQCRHRRVTGVHPDDYKIVPKCPVCGQRKGWRIENRDYNKRGLCHCSGVVGRDGAIPHNLTHPYCDHHPQGPYNQMKRAGVSDADIPLEHLGRKMRHDEPCPF